MIASGLHSGLAIKRQRKRRMDHKRAQERRFSTRSTESGMSGSCGSLDTYRARRRSDKPNGNFDTNVGIGMLHIGVVFIVLGIFLLGSGFIPNDLDTWNWSDLLKKETWWNELVLTGFFSLILGIFLIVLNKFITKREEEDLEEYVQRALTRSRSGHALVRDLETGNMTTKRSKSSNLTEDIRQSMIEDIPQVHSPKVSSPKHFMNGELLSPQLEKIMEESPVQQYDEYESTTATLSPVTPCEAEELLLSEPQQMKVPSKYHQVRMTKI